MTQAPVDPGPETAPDPGAAPTPLGAIRFAVAYHGLEGRPA